MASLWWKFALPGTGTHLIRVTDPGSEQQEVLIDGSPLQAPPGTLTFTGPSASLLELQPTDAGWVLLVDGQAVESYRPELGGGPAVDAPAVAWWKFTINGMGTHHLRVSGIATDAQTVLLDGAPLDAPPGTMTFTGPAASLLELQHRDGLGWVLAVDGKVVHQHNPNVDANDPLHVWRFEHAEVMHEVSVANIGGALQAIQLDGEHVPAPPGTTMFTGPGGSLLELQQNPDGAWLLLVDGAPVQADSATGASDDAASEASWIFLSPATGSAGHQLRVLNVGRPGQQVVLDGTPLDAPEGSTTFTGPGGLLLELRRSGQAWTLFLDGVGVEAHNLRLSQAGAAASTAPPAGSAPGGALGQQALPQGVSWDADEGVYKANIRIAGKFRCLGSFASAAEASARYQEAKAEQGG